LFGGVCLVGLVLYVTLMPDIPGPPLLKDKMAHGVAFMALMTWFCGVFEMRFAPLVAIALLCLGILIELVQQQLTYRSAELADGLADMAGIGVGWALALVGLQHWTTLLESWITSDRS
jgi:hypothetical protein